MSELSDRLQHQIEAFHAHRDAPLTDIDGFKQTIEDPSTLFLDVENAREHSPENLQSIGESLNAFGFRKNSVCVQEGSRVVYAGNGIVTYLVYNEIDVCPVLWIPEEFTEEQAKAFALADNRTSDLSTWNLEQLQENLAVISEEYDLERLGFDSEFMSQFEDADGGDATSRLTGEVETIDYTFSLTPEEAERLDIALRSTEAETSEKKLLAIVDAFLQTLDTDGDESA